MTFEPVWGTIIAWYLFLAGLGGGAFITSTYLHLRAPHAVHLMRYGRIIGPVAVCIGLVLLIFDATAGFHNPLRFVFLLTNFGSVMTWGVVFLAAFVVVALIVAVMDLLGKGRKIPLWLDVVGAALGLCVCVYTGCLLGVAKTFPLWNNALLPVLFLVSAVSTGMASVLLVGIFGAPNEFHRVADLKKFHFWLPVVELFLVASLLFVTASSAESAGFASVMNLMAGDCALAFWLVFILLGLVVPTLLEWKMLFMSSKEVEESRTGHMISAASDVLVLVGGFTLRLLVLVAAMPITLVQPWM